MKVGDKLWCVPTYGKAHEVTVEKIGRKWFTIKGGWGPRISIETMYADGGNSSSPGRCWLSCADWEQEQKADKLWRELQMRTGYLRPPHLCCSDIRKVAEILKIKLNPE